ncbi:calcium-binding protein [Shinella sp.]|uniref:calcium-binding protein n=1 Tax=Shinella sp. TaxID=1870904 RepID=UPI004036D3A3
MLRDVKKISSGDFHAEVVKHLKKSENPQLVGETSRTKYGGVHDDGVGIPTVGYGLNLKSHSFDLITKAFKLALKGSVSAELSTTQQSGLNMIKAWKEDPTGAKTKKLLDIAAGKAGTEAEQRALASLRLTDSEASRLLKEKLDGREGLFKSVENELSAKLKSLGATLPAHSEERLVLLSLYYNSPSLIGSGIANAIITDNHARLWYEVRYNHANYNMKGLQNRREDESNLIDILGPKYKKDPDKVAEGLGFLFSRKGEQSSVYEKIVQRDKEIIKFDPESATKEAFKAKLKPYLDILSKEFSEGDRLDFVQWGTKANDTFTPGVAKHAKLTEAKTNDLIITGDGTNTVDAGGGNDWIYGGKHKDKIDAGEGDDTIFGGAGDDTIDGGAGADVMHGGAGRDTYFVDDVLDRVIDPDGGEISTKIGLNKLVKNIDTYTNNAPGLTHKLKLDTSLLPSIYGPDLKLVFFNGSRGNDTYQFTLTDKNVTVQMHTGTGKDRVLFKVDSTPELGTTTVLIEDLSSADRFDISAFHARPFDEYDYTDEESAGRYYYQGSLAKQGALFLIYVDEADPSVTYSVLNLISFTPDAII